MPPAAAVVAATRPAAPPPSLVVPTGRGLYCAAGDFYVDPWAPVPRAVVTHAHSDHARAGCEAYLASTSGLGVLRERLGGTAPMEGLAWGERRRVGEVSVSLHPAGHILGSAQVRLEHRGAVTVVSGDYKTAPDASCETFEPVPCHVFISESTFGLPIYRWPAAATVVAEVHAWWRANAAAGVTSVLFAYSLGKAQRLLAALDPAAGPIGVHSTVAKMLPHYLAEGRPLPPVVTLDAAGAQLVQGRGLVIAPESVANTPWLARLNPCALALASGWMRLRGARRRRALDRGFVLSDHADWPGLLDAIAATGATSIGLTHGFTAPLARFLRETRACHTFELTTRFHGEAPSPEATEPDASEEAGEDDRQTNARE